MRICQLLAVAIVLSLLGACSRGYSGQHFSYPPGSKPHEDNWQYAGVVRQWEPLFKSIAEKGKRKVDIVVTTKDYRKVLEDSFHVESAGLRPRITWNRFAELVIVLYEEGNQFADDEYNKKLIREGPRKIAILLYDWNGEGFVKKSSEQVVPPDRQ